MKGTFQMKQLVICALTLALTPCLFGQDMSSPDKKFVEKAAMGGKAEVELGNLALQKASDSKVKQFAQKMVDDHTQANQKLQQVAEQEHMTLPSSMEPDAQKAQERLSKLSGDEFDKAYMHHQLKDHQKDVAEFQKEASSGKDPAVKSFAQSTLPILQEHLRLAEQIAPKENTQASK
jgi:putative membrane protein